MFRFIIICFIYFSLTINGQSQYRLNFIISSDFPVRNYLGLKLGAEKGLSFSLKAGYQYPAYGIGPFLSDNLEVIPSIGFTGLFGNFSTELNFKKPFFKMALDYELGKLDGYFRSPLEFNVGRDYEVTDYHISAYNHILLIGFNFYSKKHSNFSLNLKIGGGYRTSKETIYYKGSRLPSSKNELSEPIINRYGNRFFIIRFGTTYCFRKLSKTKKTV